MMLWGQAELIPKYLPAFQLFQGQIVYLKAKVRLRNCLEKGLYQQRCREKQINYRHLHLERRWDTD